MFTSCRSDAAAAYVWQQLNCNRVPEALFFTSPIMLESAGRQNQRCMITLMMKFNVSLPPTASQPMPNNDESSIIYFPYPPMRLGARREVQVCQCLLARLSH
jgi:hypothetical protein